MSQQGAMELVKTADAVVIGGGCVGVSAAYHLARRGAGRVVLLEKKYLTAGATGASAAIVRQHYAHPTTARLALESLQVFENFGELVGGTADWVRTGFMVGVGPEGVEEMAASMAVQRNVGIRTELLAPQDLVDLEPAINLDGLAAVAYEPDSGYVDAYAVVMSYANAARQMGAKIYQELPATRIDLKGGRVSGVGTPDGTIATPVVINAAGPWANQIGRLVGLEWPLRLSWHHAVVVGTPPDLGYRPTIFCDMVNRVYSRPETGQCLIIGSTDDEDVVPLPSPERLDDPAPAPGMGFCMEMADRLARRYPTIGEAGTLRRSWSGPMSRTPDMCMVLDRIEEVGGFYCAIGLSGHGFKLCPMIGALMAELVLEGEVTSHDISLFAAKRFESDGRERGPVPSHSLLG